ncbi:MAG TPA: phosphotransferase [Longimicrobium sp.]|nr:phosphotransferase [Longimicrobium sp.]
MSQPWEAEIEVTAALALALVRERFPELGARVAEPFGSGWDNTAFLVDGTLVFRFPRKESTVELLERESRVLPALAPRLPLPVPVPEWVGRGTEAYPWTFAGYRRLAGRPACGAALSDADRAAAAPVLGRFLAALHATPPEGLDLPGDVIRRTDFAYRMPALIDRLYELQDRGVVGDPGPWLRLFEDEDLPGPPPAPAVVHGDLYVRHLLVDDENRLAGVIDWGDVHLGDPAVDLSVLYGFFSPAARDDLLREYGEIDERTRRTARLRAAFHAAALAWFAHSVRDRALLDAAKTALGYVLEA